jgi:hypothetical protein
VLQEVDKDEKVQGSYIAPKQGVHDSCLLRRSCYGIQLWKHFVKLTTCRDLSESTCLLSKT